jgi:hypothetical protein
MSCRAHDRPQARNLPHHVSDSAGVVAQAEAVAIGQHHIENQDVVSGLVEEPARLGGVGSHINGVPRAMQAAHDEGSEPQVVLDHQDLHRAAILGPRS